MSTNLSPAMVTALKGAEVISGQAYVAEGTKAQTIKGLESRGLTLPESRVLSVDGVEAARQLGNDVTTYNEAASVAETLQDERTTALLTETQQGALDDLAELLDTPVVVPNRKDKRRAKFSLRGAVSRLNERKRARRAAKYGDTKFVQAA